MMGCQSRQMAMIFVDVELMIPENHLLRKIDRMVSFDFIYDYLAPYYSKTGRPSIDPVSMFKMLLIGSYDSFYFKHEYNYKNCKHYWVKQPNTWRFKTIPNS